MCTGKILTTRIKGMGWRKGKTYSHHGKQNTVFIPVVGHAFSETLNARKNF